MLKITVTGEVRTGKSTVAHAIREMLREAGFVVEPVQDFDEHTAAWHGVDRTRERLAAIAEKQEPITIEVVQVAREPKHKCCGRCHAPPRTERVLASQVQEGDWLLEDGGQLLEVFDVRPTKPDDGFLAFTFRVPPGAGGRIRQIDVLRDNECARVVKAP